MCHIYHSIQGPIFKTAVALPSSWTTCYVYNTLQPNQKIATFYSKVRCKMYKSHSTTGWKYRIGFKNTLWCRVETVIVKHCTVFPLAPSNILNHLNIIAISYHTSIHIWNSFIVEHLLTHFLQSRLLTLRYWERWGLLLLLSSSCLKTHLGGYTKHSLKHCPETGQCCIQ